ncbi:MAG: MFS transporter [Chloroflexota bacterium]|nr:MFS transporter [Chloroflexota bacterium]
MRETRYQQRIRETRERMLAAERAAPVEAPADAAAPPKPRLDFKQIVPIFTLTFVDVLGLTVILPLLHLYAAAYGATPVQIGLVAAAFPLAQLIGVPIMGALSDRYGRKPLLLISQLSTFVGFLMLASAQSLEMVILSRVVDGLFGANLATAQAAITDVTDERTRAQGLGLTGAAFGLGFLFGPAIALFSLEISDSLATPALTAAGYSLMSILLTLFMFRETLPPEQRAKVFRPVFALFGGWRIASRTALRPLIGLMFAQQVIFFGFESLLGLFILSRLGFLGQGSAIIFIYVGLILVYVQARLIGRWSRKYGERRLLFVALAALSSGLMLVALTPASPHPLYVQRGVERALRDLAPTSTEAIIGALPITLPQDSARGFGGILWFALAAIPLAVGAGLIRPALNSLMIKAGGADERGAILGVSAAAVSLADAIAPLLGGAIFQALGASAPFALGGVVMGALLVVSLRVVRPAPSTA